MLRLDALVDGDENPSRGRGHAAAVRRVGSAESERVAAAANTGHWVRLAAVARPCCSPRPGGTRSAALSVWNGRRVTERAGLNLPPVQERQQVEEGSFPGGGCILLAPRAIDRREQGIHRRVRGRPWALVGVSGKVLRSAVSWSGPQSSLGRKRRARDMVRDAVGRVRLW